MDGPRVSQTAKTPANAAFGVNAWLVDELYQQYLADKTSVDEAWWDFFADYPPVDARAENVPAAIPLDRPVIAPASRDEPTVGQPPVSTARPSLTTLVTSSAGSAPAVAPIPVTLDSPAATNAAEPVSYTHLTLPTKRIV